MLIVDVYQCSFTRSRAKLSVLLLSVLCAVRICELRPRAAGCEDLWQRDVGGDKVGKTWAPDSLSFSFFLFVPLSLSLVSHLLCTPRLHDPSFTFFFLFVYNLKYSRCCPFNFTDASRHLSRRLQVDTEKTLCQATWYGLHACPALFCSSVPMYIDVSVAGFGASVTRIPHIL